MAWPNPVGPQLLAYRRHNQLQPHGSDKAESLAQHWDENIFAEQQSGAHKQLSLRKFRYPPSERPYGHVLLVINCHF